MNDRLQEAAKEVVIHCRDCGGTLLYVETQEGYEVIHACKDGKQVREMFEAALASQPSAEGDCDECGLAFDNIIHHTTAADDRIRNASHEFVAPSGPKETSVVLDAKATEAKAIELAACPDALRIKQALEKWWLSGRAASDLRAKLESLRELSEKATAGPWEAKTFCSPPDGAYIVDSNGHLLIGAAKKITVWDSHFIVACVNAVRAIIEGKDCGHERR